MRPAVRPYSPVLVPIIGIGLVVVFALLYGFDRSAYFRLLDAWMLHPFPRPFIDWEFVPDAAACWSRGVDVYVATPCYALAPTMPHPYSPLWLRFSFLPTGERAVVSFGIAWAVLFWASQAYIPPPNSPKELALTLLVAASSLTAFALERGNIDLIIFLLAISGAALWLGSLPLRMLAYAVFLFAGLLKFYPLALLLLALRERPAVFAGVAAAVAIVLAGAVLGVWDELVAVSHNIPRGAYFTDLFGAVNLPFGLPTVLAYIARKAGAGPANGAASFAWVGLPAYLALIGVTVLGAFQLTFRGGMQEAVAAMPARPRALLLVGAVLLCGCFFAGQSVGYRGIFLILLMPGLFELRRSLPPMASRCVQAAICAIVFVAWVLTLEYLSVRAGLTHGYALDTDGYGLVHWLLHELAWWWIVGILMSTILSFAFGSETGVWVRSGLAGKMVGRRHADA